MLAAAALIGAAALVAGCTGGGPTAGAQPSAIPGAGEVPAPEPIPADQLGERGNLMLVGSEPLSVAWIEPGRTIAVLLGESGTADCVPTPIGATSSGPGSIEVAFEPATSTGCTDDFVVYGWRFTLPEAISAELVVDVRATGTSDAGTYLETTVGPEDVLERG